MTKRSRARWWALAVGACAANLAWSTWSRPAAAADDASSPPPAAAAQPAATRPATTRPATTRPATTRPATTRPVTARPVPRPTASAEAYEARADELRAAYAKPAAEWPAATIDPGVEYVELGLLRKPVHPADNPYSAAKAELGKMLFFDPRLSGSRTIACASCHEPELGWSDGRAVSFGHGRSPLKRNAPALANVAHRTSFFWDGRAPTLEAPALEPIAAGDEMNADPAEVVALLGKQPEYRRRFAEAFGGGGQAAGAGDTPGPESPAAPPRDGAAADAGTAAGTGAGADPAGATDPVTLPRIAQALATYQRTIVSRPSRFDKFLAGNSAALSDAAVRGLHLFRTDARCANCHMGPTFTDEKFHEVGLSYYGRPFEDLGRYHATKNPADAGKFRTPSLRNVPRTAPYMHNGLFDLAGVLNMYNAGMPTIRRKAGQEDDERFPTKSPLLKPLSLNAQDLADLKAFLESLEEIRLRVRPPALPGLGKGAADGAEPAADEVE